MDAYISEAQVVSGDEVDGLHTEVIPPGHRTICSARLNLEITGRELSKQSSTHVDQYQ